MRRRWVVEGRWVHMGDGARGDWFEVARCWTERGAARAWKAAAMNRGPCFCERRVRRA